MRLEKDVSLKTIRRQMIKKKKAPPFPFTYIPILDHIILKIKKSKRKKKEVLETNMTSIIKCAKTHLSCMHRSSKAKATIRDLRQSFRKRRLKEAKSI